MYIHLLNLSHYKSHINSLLLTWKVLQLAAEGGTFLYKEPEKMTFNDSREVKQLSSTVTKPAVDKDSLRWCVPVAGTSKIQALRDALGGNNQAWFFICRLYV